MYHYFVYTQVSPKGKESEKTEGILAIQCGRSYDCEVERHSTPTSVKRKRLKVDVSLIYILSESFFPI